MACCSESAPVGSDATLKATFLSAVVSDGNVSEMVSASLSGKAVGAWCDEFPRAGVGVSGGADDVSAVGIAAAPIGSVSM